MIEAAGAVHHAHDKGIIHRDIKPDNIMLDRSGHCWVIDFGLAGLLRSAKEPRPETAVADPLLDSLTSETEVGTQFYMAPEQFDGLADNRTDIWGLGVTLYELLTLHRPFDGATKHELRERITRRRWTVPPDAFTDTRRDLMAICQKATAADPAKRYQTAGELRTDLVCWLDHRPITARKRNVFALAALAIRRRPAFSLAIACLVLMVLGLFGTVVGWQVEVAQRSRRELMMLQLERLRTGVHYNGWSADALRAVEQIAAISRDDELRDQYAATLAGMDARLLFQEEFDGSSVALDAAGRRVLVGGWKDKGAMLWDLDTGQRQQSRQPGPGPVAFDRRGVPLALVAPQADPKAIWLWDVQAQTRRARLEFPAGAGGVPSVMALSADGELAAAALAGGTAETSCVVVWEAAAPGAVRSVIEALATSLAFAPDGSLLAAGDEGGNVKVYSLPEGRSLRQFSMGRTAIKALAFAGSQRVSAGAARGRLPWLLAVGNDGGELEIWDLGTARPMSRCPGSEWSVDSIAFSPDGATLASTGRMQVRFWEIATGKQVLQARAPNVVTGVTFSADGNRAAFSSIEAFRSPGRTGVYELESGRGLLTLRGLSTPSAKVRFSRDGSWLAAVSHDWQVGIWRLPQGELLRVIDVPAGLTADNSALAFDGDGNRFAFAAAGAARLWRLEPFEELRQWELESAAFENLAFDKAGRLLLVRAEVERSDTAQRSHVSTVRDLLGDPTRPLACIRDFNRAIDRIRVPDDGSYLVLVGECDSDSGLPQIAAFDAVTGARMWKHNGYTDRYGRGIWLDPAGASLAYYRPSGVKDEHEVVAMPEGDTAGTVIIPSPLGMHPKGTHWLVDNGRGAMFFDVERSVELVNLAIDNGQATSEAAFSHDGRYAAWCNRDGTITLADLEEVRRRLNQFNMGW
jgi:WD40 repeat protein